MWANKLRSSHPVAQHCQKDVEETSPSKTLSNVDNLYALCSYRVWKKKGGL